MNYSQPVGCATEPILPSWNAVTRPAQSHTSSPHHLHPDWVYGQRLLQLRHCSHFFEVADSFVVSGVIDATYAQDNEAEQAGHLLNDRCHFDDGMTEQSSVLCSASTWINYCCHLMSVQLLCRRPSKPKWTDWWHVHPFIRPRIWCWKTVSLKTKTIFSILTWSLCQTLSVCTTDIHCKRAIIKHGVACFHSLPQPPNKIQARYRYRYRSKASVLSVFQTFNNNLCILPANVLIIVLVLMS